MSTAKKASTNDDAAAGAHPSNKRRNLIIIAVVAILCAGGGVGAGMHFFAPSDPSGPPKKVENTPPPIFVSLEPLTVNLQPEQEGSSDQYLQVTLTLQVGEREHEEMLKQYMPLVRSRLLLLLSSKKASEISTEDGKKKLSDDILKAIRKPYSDKGPEQRVMNVFFSTFVVQ
jgi:flagellar FliL protein